MTSYELYVFFLCLVVFTALTALCIGLIAIIVKQAIRLIRAGQEDEAIIKEFSTEKKVTCFDKLSKFVSVVVSLIFFIAFAFGLFLSATETKVFSDIPSLKIVMSGSMSYKNKGNTYLEQNGLHDQIRTFDMVVVRKLPKESELKKYDIIVYEYEGELIIHRIISIEEPNEKHPDERYFLCRGDAVEISDKFPVLYEQMRGIYRGERVPFIGSFFAFMQSPAGALCILLIVFSMIAVPIVEKKLFRTRELRYYYLQEKRAEKESYPRADEYLSEYRDYIFTYLPPSEYTVDKMGGDFGKPNGLLFLDSLKNASEKAQKYYEDISSFLLSFSGVQSFYQGAFEVFTFYGYEVVKLEARGKKLVAHIKGKTEDCDRNRKNGKSTTESLGYPVQEVVSSDSQCAECKALMRETIDLYRESL